MTTTLYALIAVLVSAAALLRLALRDPKRLRSLRQRSAPEPRRLRRALAAACMAPGLALALIGQWPAFLIWLGGLTAGGWLLTLGLARASDSLPTARR